MKFIIIVQICRINISLIFSMFNTSCFVVYGKSCIMFIFSFIHTQEHSGVTVSMLAFHAGGQGSNPTIDKFFHEKNETYFHKIVSCKSCITFIFSYINLYEYSGVMVSMVAFLAGGQGSNIPNTFFFFHLKWTYFFLQFIISFFKFYSWTIWSFFVSICW